jgi:hypothetical protein
MTSKSEYYYIKLPNGEIVIGDKFKLDLLKMCRDGDKVEVPDDVPTYEEWKASYNCMFDNEVLLLKNMKLREMLKECREILSSQKMYGIGTSRIWNAVILIDELLGDKADE